MRARIGDQVRAGDPLIELHFRGSERLPVVRTLIENAVHISDEPPPERPLVLDDIG